MQRVRSSLKAGMKSKRVPVIELQVTDASGERPDITALPSKEKTTQLATHKNI
jgi:hypothetical protein